MTGPAVCPVGWSRQRELSQPPCFVTTGLRGLTRSRRGFSQVRWNVAMSFASYGGNKHWEKALELLTRLATDERRYVWRAVASALRYIGRRRPEQVRPILEEWLRDERLRRPAEVALKYIGD